MVLRASCNCMIREFKRDTKQPKNEKCAFNRSQLKLKISSFFCSNLLSLKVLFSLLRFNWTIEQSIKYTCNFIKVIIVINSHKAFIFTWFAFAAADLKKFKNYEGVWFGGVFISCDSGALLHPGKHVSEWLFLTPPPLSPRMNIIFMVQRVVLQG